jgi:Flp pilus assembly protein TadG
VRRRTDLKRDDGVAMTEFALILPVFLFIVVGLLAFGRVFFYWIQANHLASETARWAIVDRNPYAPDGASPPGAGGKTLQQQAADSSTVEFKGGVKVCIDFPPRNAGDPANTLTTVDLGDPVRVRVEKPFTPIPFLKVATITIRGSSTMRIERFANNVDPSAYTDAQNIGTCS